MNRDHARGIARTWRACIILPQGATGQAIRLCRRRYSALTTPAVTGCSRESEQSKNGAGGMVPLYAARVQDLGPDDVAVFKCGACGHTAELPPSALIRGLGLQPIDKVLDLERRLRCRLCYARGQAIGRPIGFSDRTGQQPRLRQPGLYRTAIGLRSRRHRRHMAGARREVRARC